ncbi:hypothetical protein KAZ57_01415 [Patescibacteria group bacterium]|nr:hypothetical protein [Patescibacteria group bacterium]
MNQLSETATSLKKNALKIINDWDLLNYLSKFGGAYIVGSVELDLMTWRDIDVEIIADNIPTKNNAIEISGYLFNKIGVRKVTPIDYSDGDGVKKPKGLYIGAEYVDNENNKWKVDVWLLEKDSARTKDKTEMLKQKLTPEFTEIILDIKSELSTNPKYRKEITSVDVYTAVMDNGIKDIAGFKQYLSQKGVAL